MKAVVKIGKMQVARADGACGEFIAATGLSYFAQYVEEFLNSDAKTMILKLEKSK